MEINLEKIELVKDRTGCTYAEAKEALEKSEGSVVDAIIDIEEKLNKEFDAVDGGSLKDSPIFAKMKEIVEKGNVTKILIRKGEKTIVNFPLTAGVIGAVLIPWGAILGIVAALGAQCEIDFVDDKGEVIDINGKAVGMYDKAKDAVMKGVDMAQSAIGKAGKEGGTIDEVLDKVEDSAYKFSDKMQEFGDKSSAKVSEAWDKLDDNGTVDDIREAFVKGTAKVMELWDKLEKSGKIDEVKETVEKVARKAADTAKGIAKEASERAAKAEEDFKADADQAADEEFKDEEI
ncbi:MAG: DUF4342 domain-containing protein [Mogibacterium sp.]|nr:DUF4342 domain-containing protein [Mogibacterium sp.]MBR2540616.1 DUF4342 domain-containing protein [Mogibacterium sp.]